MNADGITILYNEEMAKLEKTKIQNVIGKPFREVFSYIPEEESTLMRALKERKATKNQPQTYLNEFGKEISTVNSTIPIIVDGKVIAAMEVARDITDIKNMSDTILDLQSDLTADRPTRRKESGSTPSKISSARTGNLKKSSSAPERLRGTIPQSCFTVRPASARNSSHRAFIMMA